MKLTLKNKYCVPIAEVVDLKMESFLCQSLEGIGEGGEHGWGVMEHLDQNPLFL